MKSEEVIQILQISRQTLSKYVREGKIKAVRMPNGWYHYDADSVYAFLNAGRPRKTCIYARVSGNVQKADLEQQIRDAKSFCYASGFTVSEVFSDIAPGNSFENRPGFFRMLGEIEANNVERVVVLHKNRLVRDGIGLIEHIFDRYRCKIIALDQDATRDLDKQEKELDIHSMGQHYKTESEE